MENKNTQSPVVHEQGSIHYSELGVGEYLHQCAGCFLRNDGDKFVQVDGGYSIEVSQEQLSEWYDDPKSWMYIKK